MNGFWHTARDRWFGLQARERKVLVIALCLLMLVLFWRLAYGVWEFRNEGQARLAQEKEVRVWMQAQAERLALQPEFCPDETLHAEPIEFSLERMIKRHQLVLNSMESANETWRVALSSLDGSAMLRLAVDAACHGLRLTSLSIVQTEEEGAPWKTELVLSSSLPDAGHGATLAMGRMPQWRWFPVPAQPGLAGERQYEALPEADIDGQLLGVVITPQQAYATVRLSGAAERVFHRGDELRPGIRLEAVEPFRIIINQQGRERQLSLPRFRQAGSVQGNTASTGTGGSALRSGVSATLAGLFSAETVSTDAGPGLAISSLPAGQAPPEGLEADDVIVAINGQALAEVMADPAGWPSLMANTALPVTVLREGSETLVYINATGLGAQLLPFAGNRND